MYVACCALLCPAVPCCALLCPAQAELCPLLTGMLQVMLPYAGTPSHGSLAVFAQSWIKSAVKALEHQYTTSLTQLLGLPGQLGALCACLDPLLGGLLPLLALNARTASASGGGAPWLRQGSELAVGALQ